MGETPNEAVEAALLASRALFGMVVRTLAQDLPEFTLTQYRSLVILSYQGDLRPRDLVTEVGVSAATAGRICKKLEDQGLAVRFKDLDDGRGTLVRITSKGQELLARVHDRRRAVFTYQLQRMPPEYQGVLAVAFTRFAEVVGEPLDHDWLATPEMD